MLSTVIAALLLLACKAERNTPTVSLPSKALPEEPIYSPPLAEQLPFPLLPPSLFVPASPQYRIAKLLVEHYLTNPNVESVSQFDTILRSGNRVQAYRQWYTTQHGRYLWQMCAIDTPYGHIYLSVQLDDEGIIPAATAGVSLAYDNDSIEWFIMRTTAQQLKRFGEVVFHGERTVSDERVLRLLLGDAYYPHSINQIFMEGEDFY